MKQQNFVFNICFLIFLNLLIKPFWILGIDVGVQNAVGAADYGLYFAVFNFTYLFNMLLDMGITNFNNRNIARHSQLLSKHLSGIITLKMLLGVVYLGVTFGVAAIIGYGSLQMKILFWTAINQFLNSFILYLRSNVSALMMFKTDSVLSVLDRLLTIIFCSILLWGNVTSEPFRIEWFIYCQTAAYLIAAFIALMIVIAKGRPQSLSFNVAFWGVILKKSLPFAVLYLLMSFYNRIDAVMIERLLPGDISTFEAGIYASAFRLLDAMVMIAYLFSVILLPLFSKMLKEKEDLIPIIKASFSLLCFFSVTSVVLLLVYRYPVLDLLYTSHIEESAAVFRWLIPGIIPISFTYIFGTLLTANGDMKLLNITALAGIVVNVIVNLLLIPRMHAVGAAIASLSTQTVVSVLQLWIAFRKLHLPASAVPWLRCLIYALLLPALVMAMVTLMVPVVGSLQLPTLWTFLASAVAACLLALVTGVIPISFLRSIKLKDLKKL